MVWSATAFPLTAVAADERDCAASDAEGFDERS
jgi:hypothetical protein